jgi:Mg2+-importing ATPase
MGNGAAYGKNKFVKRHIIVCRISWFVLLEQKAVTESGMPRDSSTIQGNYSALPIEELFGEIKTSKTGLSAEEAQARLVKYGRNEVGQHKKRSAIVKFLRLLSNPLLIILLIAGAISGFTGQAVDALIIFSIVILSTVLLVYQESKAETAAESLRRKVAITATILRDGKKQEIITSEVVLGDVSLLSPGDIVPADSRIIESKDLSIDQSALTGESFPVEKTSEPAAGATGVFTVTDLPNIVFAGTSVITGFATSVVVATGVSTEYGKIAEKLAGRQTDTEFEKGLRRFSALITEITILLVLFVFLVNALYHRGILESLLFAVALAVGLTPELLPMIMTVNLSQGALSMSKKGVIVKRLESIQNLGSMDILCTDKTGTLTENKIVLSSYVDSNFDASDKVLLFAALNSRLQTGLRNPLDAAIINRSTEVDTKNYSKVDEIPYDFVRKRVSVVVADTQHLRYLITKGAPEEIIKICAAYETSAGALELDGAVAARITAWHDQQSSEGMRVLGLCFRQINQPDRTQFAVADEKDMIYLGLLTFEDPPKKDAGESLAQLRKSNVELKILTGDNELVSKYICEQLGFEVSQTVLGREIETINDDALRPLVERANLFARVTPIDKNRIINALRKNDHVVGFMGDGINDAPSLKASDVGLSVDNAVDVAKESADIILLQKSLSVLNEGVLEGRKTFGNTMKYVMMGISSNFGNMFSMAGASLILPFLPMLPTQILLNNLMYDMSESTIPSDNIDDEYLERPKRLDISYIRIFMVVFGVISSVFDYLTFFLMLDVFRASAPLFQTAWFMESFATQTLVVFVIRTRVTPFWKSKPSRLLAASTLGLTGVAMIIPFSPLGAPFGFVSPPFAFIAILGAYILVYLALVELAKKWFYGKFSYRIEKSKPINNVGLRSKIS